MIKRTFWILLVLIVCVIAQRGGGRGGGGRSSGGRSSFSSGRSFWSHRGGSRVRGSLPLWPTVGIIGGGAASVGGYFLYKRLTKRREFFNNQCQLRNGEAQLCSMAEGQFERERQKFLEKKWNFVYTQGTQRHNSYVTGITMKQEKPFLYRMMMDGTDGLGKWASDGYFMGSPEGVKFWMVKDYADKNLAGQTGAWEYLIYEGAQSAYKNYKGKWYYCGFENSELYSGLWEINLVQPLISEPVPYS